MKNKKVANNEEGLPEVAEKQQKKNHFVLVILAFVLLIFGSVYFYTKSNKRIIKPAEEIYTVQKNPSLQPVEDKKALLKPAPPLRAIEQKKELTAEEIAFIQNKQRALRERLSAPLMMINNNLADKSLGFANEGKTRTDDPNMRFMYELAGRNTDTRTASVIKSLNYTIAEGSLIHAALESATNSDLPGFVRAIVSIPSYSEDGTKILIPRGSRLIGQYKSGMHQGQSRIFIVWTRLITPQGISLNLGSPGVDGLGTAGVAADDIDRHFWERFGTASLLSIIGAGTANLGVKAGAEANSAALYRAGIANSFSESANETLQQESNISPTLKTYQGKPIIVFVAHDLNFKNAMQHVKPTIQVF